LNQQITTDRDHEPTEIDARQRAGHPVGVDGPRQRDEQHGRQRPSGEPYPAAIVLARSGFAHHRSRSNVAADGALSAAAEFHHTGLRYYEHRIVNSGVAFDRTLLGDPLGPKGDGGYLRLMWDAGGEHALTLDAAVERRFGNIYQAISNSAVDESDFHFIVLEHKPAEWRRRVVGTWVIHPAGRRRITLQAGYERVRNFNFSDGAHRNGVMASAAFDLLRW
jgi:hypothetical protein